MRTLVAVLAIAILFAGTIPATAQSMMVPAGTKILLKFLTPVDSATIKEGAEIKFSVAADVLISRTAIFQTGTPAMGIVTDVSHPGIFGKNARVHISHIQVNAVDGKPVTVSPLDVTPETVRQVSDIGAAGATSLTGAILLGPIGLAAGAFIHGGDFSLPAGAVGTVSVAEAFRLGAVP